jgi:hypothetical protein
VSFAFWYAIKLAMGVRVGEEEEIEGLDVGEHGITAYPDFATHPESFGGRGAPAAAATRQLVAAHHAIAES